MTSLFAWLQATGIASAIADSTIWTGSLSAAHVVGFTLVMGGALVANLRSLGALFPPRQAIDLEPSANRIILGGLAISLLTGVLLFSVRAIDAAANGTFRLKMLLLVAAVLVHFGLRRRTAARATPSRATSTIGLTLWLALAVAACAFILLE